MNTGRLGSFRSGDRSEYLAAYALSRVAFVTPVPRPEDFGVVDFLCVLARSDSKYILPEGAFYVQVKSNREPIEFKGTAVSWLAKHMAHPLFVCIVDKGDASISLYSCAIIWNAIFRTRVPPNSVRIEFDGTAAVQSDANTIDYEVNLGKPVFKQTSAQIEEDAQTAYDVLKTWVDMDGGNIALRNVGRVAVRTPEKWETNIPLAANQLLRTTYWFGPDFNLVERDLAPILTALAHNYHHASASDKLEKLRAFIATIPEHLDQHGRDCVDGKWSCNGSA